MLSEMIQRVEPSEGCCPYFGGARPGNGGPLLTCRGKETLISSRESFAAKLPRCTGAPRDCWVYLMQYLKDQGIDPRGKSEKELRNMYDGCRLKEGLRAGRELSCDYYNNNARPGCEIPDQEAIRRERERRQDDELFEELLRESDDEADPESGQAELARPAETVPAAASEVPAPPRPLADITAEIRFYKAQTVSNILEIGRRLIEAKAQLGHGQWLKWLEEEVEFSRQTADRFMQLSREYANCSPVSNLSYTKLLALLAVPAEERDAFIEVTHEVNGEQKTVAEMSRRELEQAIKERDEARRIARVNEEASLAAAAEKARLALKLDELQGQLNQAQARGESLSGHNRTLTDKIRALESRPVEVAVAEPPAERIAEIRREGYEQARAELAASAQPVILLAQPLLQYNEIAEGAASLLIAAAGQSANGEGDRMLTAGVDTLRRQIERLEEARGRLASAVRTLFPDAGDIDW